VTGPAYVGRFAPSPTGPLHFGSLVTALASFLDARASGGKWLVRMEDIDPPRELPGAADTILRQLEQHHLCWDGSVLYQSSRQDAYRQALATLVDMGLVYACDCNRVRIRQLGGVYDGRCLNRKVPDLNRAALRVRLPAETSIGFYDLVQGDRRQCLDREVGDFVLRRRDGLFAYQLAVVVDDLHQSINHIIRGCDLLDSTVRQLYLFSCLGADAPDYGHIPLVLNSVGQKLSKQNLAAGISGRKAGENLWWALTWLGLSPPPSLRRAGVDDLLNWGVDAWSLDRLRALPARQAPPGY